MEHNELKTAPTFVLLACCTFRRPKLFSYCLESLSKIKIPEGIKAEILVIDNDENGSARRTIEKFEDKIQIKINYFIESKRGLSNARNRLISEAVKLNATHILMFDDDIILPEHQLENYLKYYENNKESVILTAASYSKFTEKVPKYIEKNDLFKTSTTKKTGQKRKDCAAGNVFFPTTLMTKLGLKFSDEYVFMGGEDGKFFREASNRGATIVWCNEGHNFEINDTDKATLEWILKRSYYNGFSAAFLKTKDMPVPDRLSYAAKYNACFVFNCMIFPFSIIAGPTGFVNMLGFCAKSLGRLVGSTSSTPLNHYEIISGK